ncbi:4-oxalocrotonate tautomerase [Neobacillus piezotolerans]|uniref:Tautomerase n=1 Tax=Neobacillus piezotolerans TaxID=2259171 RepID=A0A3D8GXF5_9BACI|nr:4-oxalocrotonate tautomerase [Neobacillus piezotolerans]RDU38746.1 4-oxalocrotonate tautomerase [Neobacillus piezotolerans]
MPLVNIQIMEGRSRETINDLMKNVTNIISETLNAPKENIRVIVTEVPKTHWAIGGTSAKDLGR